MRRPAPTAMRRPSPTRKRRPPKAGAASARCSSHSASSQLSRKDVARIERSEIRDSHTGKAVPDFAALNPGYNAVQVARAAHAVLKSPFAPAKAGVQGPRPLAPGFPLARERTDVSRAALSCAASTAAAFFATTLATPQ